MITHRQSANISLKINTKNKKNYFVIINLANIQFFFKYIKYYTVKYMFNIYYMNSSDISHIKINISGHF